MCRRSSLWASSYRITGISSWLHLHLRLIVEQLQLHRNILAGVVGELSIQIRQIGSGRNVRVWHA